MAAATPALAQLGRDELESVFAWLDEGSLVQATCVSRLWQQAASADTLWQKHCLRDWPTFLQAHEAAGASSRKPFHKRYAQYANATQAEQTNSWQYFHPKRRRPLLVESSQDTAGQQHHHHQMPLPLEYVDAADVKFVGSVFFCDKLLEQRVLPCEDAVAGNAQWILEFDLTATGDCDGGHNCSHNWPGLKERETYDWSSCFEVQVHAVRCSHGQVSRIVRSCHYPYHGAHSSLFLDGVVSSSSSFSLEFFPMAQPAARYGVTASVTLGLREAACWRSALRHLTVCLNGFNHAAAANNSNANNSVARTAVEDLAKRMERIHEGW